MTSSIPSPPEEKPHQPPVAQINWAGSIAHGVPGIYLWNSVQETLRTKIGTSHWEEYLHAILRNAGSPSDPIERMLIEQITLAYHNIARLHMAAAYAETLDHAEVYNAAAARLLGEFRRTVLALRDYRCPMAPKQVTLVQQQNLAAGDQQVAFVEGGAARPGSAENYAHTKLETMQPEAITYEPQRDLIPQPETSGGRQAEPVEARPIDAPGARALTTGCLGEPPVGAFDRPKKPRRQAAGRAKRKAPSEGADFHSPVPG